MQPCKYQHIAKCESCNVVVYKDCRMFCKWRAADLCSEIQKFKPVHDVKLSKFTKTSDLNLARTVAAKLAIKMNQPVKVLTLNQAISIALSDDQSQYPLLLLECHDKPYGDIDKVRPVIQSFVEKQRLEGVVVYYASPKSCMMYD